MLKKRKVGTGITRHTRVVANGFDDAGVKAFYEHVADYIFPPQDFRAWLTQYETRLAEMAAKRRLPTRADVMVIYDAANRHDWYAADQEEWRKIMECPEYRAGHRFNDPRAQHARWYLTATDDNPAVEASWGWQWGYQSVRWYFGTLMGLALECRRALEKEAWLELAGRCIELGKMEREFQLKWSAEKRLADYERHIAASNKGNATRAAAASRWKTLARTISTKFPDLDLVNASASARTILAAWPAKERKPSERSLRQYISTLAKRAV